MFLGANPVYDVKGFFLTPTYLAIICTLACRTSIIRGCNVTLSQEHGAITRQSENIMGTSDAISGHDITTIFYDLNTSNILLNNPIGYSVRAIAQNNSNVFEFGEKIDDVISRDSYCEFSSSYIYSYT